jgi:hypothetical protein
MAANFPCCAIHPAKKKLIEDEIKLYIAQKDKLNTDNIDVLLRCRAAG